MAARYSWSRAAGREKIRLEERFAHPACGTDPYFVGIEESAPRCRPLDNAVSSSASQPS